MDQQHLIRKNSAGYGSIPTNSVNKSPKARRWRDRRRSYSNVSSQDKGGTGAIHHTSSSKDHKTTAWQSAFHLVKGYIGCGVLSLPWAISQMGLPLGMAAVFLLSGWTSYNCWTVVRVKRFVDQEKKATEPEEDEKGNNNTTTTNNNNNNNNNLTFEESQASVRSVASSNATTTTYPDVGGWCYGTTFHKLVTATIFIQQLSVCTVFVSFVGANLGAVLKRLQQTSPFVSLLATHTGSLTLALPAILSLSFLPNLRALAPVTKTGAVFLFVGFAAIGVVVAMEWSERPQDINFTLPLNNPIPGAMDDANVSNNPHMQIPLAMCAILYSYEGICLILPVESAMKEPQKYKTVFVGSMIFVALVMALFGCMTVLCFGNVTNGSITAFLLAEYNHGDEDNNSNLTWYIMMANAAVSLSILMTYPLHMFPALELLAAWVVRTFHNNDLEDIDEDQDLEGFEPLPSLPEHAMVEHDIVLTTGKENDEGQENKVAYESNQKDDNDDDDDEKSVKSFLSYVTNALPDMEMTIPGDSIYLRTAVVVSTYLISVLVPSVESLVSLAGALAGSTNALLLPPLLELALIRHLEATQKHGASRTQRLLGCCSFPKLKCYILFLLGMIFDVIGTYFSILDIIQAYSK